MKKILLIFLVLLVLPFVLADVDTYNEGSQTTIGFGTTYLYGYLPMDSDGDASYGGFPAYNQQNVTYDDAGVIGNASYFNNYNSYINYSKGVLPDKPVSFVWFVKSQDSTGVGYIWSDTTSASTYTFNRFTVNSSGKAVYWDGGYIVGSGNIGWSGTTPQISENCYDLNSTCIGYNFGWVMFALVYNASGNIYTYERYYSNNHTDGYTLVNQTTWNGTRGNFYMGNRVALDRDLRGWIDEFQTYNQNLTVENIDRIYDDALLGIRAYSNLSTPTNLSVPNLTNSSIYITWTNPVESYFSNTSVWYNSTSNSTLTFVSTQTGTSKNITGLNPGTNYSVYIYSQATNGQNTSVGAYAVVTTSENLINTSENVPYFNDFENNMSKWSTVFTSKNICSGTAGSPVNRNSSYLKQVASGYYSSSNTTLFTPEYSAHSHTNTTTPDFVLDGSAFSVSFSMRMKYELNYDGMAIYYRYNNTGNWTIIDNQSTGVYFTQSPYSTYNGYGGHGTSTTSCMAQAFSSQDTGLLKINLTGDAATGNISFLFVMYADTNTICSDVANCGVYIDDFNITKIQSNWWNDSFSKCKNINITSSSDLVNYPEFVKLSKASSMNESFKDIRFVNTTCNNTGSGLVYELDNYTSSSATFWVLMNLSEGVNQISVYYGNDSVESESNGTKVFNQTYTAVYHMNNLNATESIGNTVSAVTNDGPAINSKGAITESINYSSASYSSEKTTLPIDEDLNLSSLGKVTVETWINSSNNANQMFFVQSQDSCSYNYFLSTYNAIISNNNIKLCYRDQSGTTRYCVDSGVLLSGNWQYVVGTYDFGDAVNDSIIYVDGERKNNRTTSYLLRTGPVTSTYIGNGCDYGSMYGSIDEVRVSKTTLSDSWINQTFQTINNTALMIVIGSETSMNGTTDSCSCPNNIATTWSVDVSDYCIITSSCVAGAFSIYGDVGNFSTADNVFLNVSSININATNSRIITGENNRWWTR